MTAQRQAVVVVVAAAFVVVRFIVSSLAPPGAREGSEQGPCQVPGGVARAEEPFDATLRFVP
jgi:hypothetical protein